MPERHIYLFGNEDWNKGLLLEEDLLVKAPKVESFSDPAKLAAEIKEKAGESIVLCQKDLAHSSDVLEAVKGLQGILFLFSSNQSALTSALIFYNQIDTLNELADTLMAESKAGIQTSTPLDE